MSKEIARVDAPLRIDPACGMTDVPPFNNEGTNFVNFGVNVFSDSGERNRHLTLTTKLTKEPNIVFIHNGNRVSLDNNLKDQLSLPRLIINRHKELHPDVSGLTIITEDNLPTGTGLGASSSLSVVFHIGLEQALATSRGEVYAPDPNNIIQRAHALEVHDLGITGGFQDYIGAYFGNLNHVDASSLSKVDLTKYPTVGIPMEEKVKEYFNSHLLVLLRKGRNISSGKVLEDAIERYKNNIALGRAKFRSIASKNKRMFELLSTPGPLQDRLEEIGQIMNETWALHKSLSPLIGSTDLCQWEQLVRPYTYGVQGPGTGANSIVLLTRENGIEEARRALGSYSKEVEILSVQINETGVNIYSSE